MRRSNGLFFGQRALGLAAERAARCSVGRGRAPRASPPRTATVRASRVRPTEPASPRLGTAARILAGAACNLACHQVHCAPDGGTTVRGHVFDPSGTVPLYNAIVYVPNGQVEPFQDGVSCDRCGVFTTGAPLITTLTGPDGAFTLTNVPAGVEHSRSCYQIGKWRRQVTIPSVPACQTTTLTNVDQQRLPRTSTEGDLPKMAIATGAADPMECLLAQDGHRPGGVHHPVRAAARSSCTTTAPGVGHPGTGWTATPRRRTSCGRTPGRWLNTTWSSCPAKAAETQKPARRLQNMVDYTRRRRPRVRHPLQLRVDRVWRRTPSRRRRSGSRTRASTTTRPIRSR